MVAFASKIIAWLFVTRVLGFQAIDVMIPFRNPAIQSSVQNSIEPIGPYQPIAPIEYRIPIGSQIQPSGDSILLMTKDQVASFLIPTGTWTTLVDQIPGKIINVDALGRIWAHNDDGTAVFVWVDGDWQDRSQGWAAPGLLPLRSEIMLDDLNQVWLATSQDVRRFDGDGWTILTPADMGMPPPEIEEGFSTFNLSYITELEQIWVYTCDWIGPGPNSGRGVRWFDGDSWHGAESPVANGCATSLDADQQGNLWVGMDTGLWRYAISADEWLHFPTPDVPEGWNFFGFVNQLNLAPNGDPWVTMQLCGGASCFGGVARYQVSASTGTWSLIGEAAHDDDRMNIFVFGAADTVWLFTENGLSIVVDDFPDYMAPLYAWDVSTDSGGNTWVGAYFEGQNYLWKLDAGNAE
jgi:hypothetical protein